MDKVIEFIVCPIDKAKLIDKLEYWQCSMCGTKYQVTEGIPNLIPEDAEQTSENKYQEKSK